MAKKRKAAEVIQDAGGSQIKQDATSGLLELAYMGTVALNVNHLDTQWKIGQQREIDPVHIDKLLDSFKSGIRPYAPATRMSAICTQAVFQKILKQFKEENPGSENSMEEIQKMSRMHHRGSSFTDFVHVKEYPAFESFPILYAGQHRRWALLQAVERQKMAIQTGTLKGDENTSWQNVCIASHPT